MNSKKLLLSLLLIVPLYIFAEGGKIDEAIKKLTPAAEDGFGEAEEFLASLLELKGQYTEAEKWYKRAPSKNALSRIYDVMESKGMLQTQLSV